MSSSSDRHSRQIMDCRTKIVRASAFKPTFPKRLATWGMSVLVGGLIISPIGCLAQQQMTISVPFVRGALAGSSSPSTIMMNNVKPFNDLDITKAIVSQLVIQQLDGSYAFGATPLQGNDFNVSLTLEYKSGTSVTFSAFVNFREGTTESIGLIVGMGSDGFYPQDESGYTVTSGSRPIYLMQLATSEENYVGGAGIAKFNASSVQAMDALNAYYNDVTNNIINPLSDASNPTDTSTNPTDTSTNPTDTSTNPTDTYGTPNGPSCGGVGSTGGTIASVSQCNYGTIMSSVNPVQVYSYGNVATGTSQTNTQNGASGYSKFSAVINNNLIAETIANLAETSNLGNTPTQTTSVNQFNVGALLATSENVRVTLSANNNPIQSRFNLSNNSIETKVTGNKSTSVVRRSTY